MKKGNSAWKGLSLLSFGLSAVSLSWGFYKMLVYENGEFYPYDTINAYVGGDAYNYIINGNYTTAFFVLATLFVILGIGSAALYYLSTMVVSLNTPTTVQSDILNDIESNLPKM